MAQFVSLLVNVALVVILLLAVLALLPNVRQVVIYETERGVLYQNGKIKRILPPGRHWYFRYIQVVSKVDVRARFVTIPGQEVLCADNVSLKISIAANFAIHDPARLLTQTANYTESLYLILQLQLRELVGETTIDDLLAKRKEMGKLLLDVVAPKASEIGITLLSVGIRDIMFPGELKNAFAQVITARNEGLAALERARGESAALRNLANAAKLLDNNPNLMQLRLLQTLATTKGHTIILKMPDGSNSTPDIVVQKSA